MDGKTGVFISYRRTSGAAEARILETFLSGKGFDVFLDVDDLASGHYDVQLLGQISTREHFLLVCSPGVFDRCQDEDDWVRREIGQAIITERNIVPIELPGFVWPTRDSLPPDIAPLTAHNAFKYDHSHWKDIREKLLRMLQATTGKGCIAPHHGLGVTPDGHRDTSLTYDIDRRTLAIARGMAFELGRLGQSDANSRRMIARSILDNTTVLPRDADARQIVVSIRLSAALELDDPKEGKRCLALLDEPSTRDSLSDNQHVIVARAEARGWTRTEERTPSTHPPTNSPSPPVPLLPRLPTDKNIPGDTDIGKSVEATSDRNRTQASTTLALNTTNEGTSASRADEPAKKPSLSDQLLGCSTLGLILFCVFAGSSTLGDDFGGLIGLAVGIAVVFLFATTAAWRIDEASKKNEGRRHCPPTGRD